MRDQIVRHLETTSLLEKLNMVSGKADPVLRINSLFLPREAMHKRSICPQAVSVRLSVCHVRGSCQNEYISSKFFHRRVATPF